MQAVNQVAVFDSLGPGATILSRRTREADKALVALAAG
jgi:hypothetical protein